MDKRNVLWEKHRLMLPEIRQKASHRCRDCLFFVQIRGKAETRRGCVAQIKIYGRLVKRVPRVVPILDVIKLVGLEGLEYSLRNSDPDAQSCGLFRLR